MARFPEAQWRPLADNWASQGRMTRYDLVILHTMVGSLVGTDGFFRKDGYGGVESHFGVGADGTVYQWQDTQYRAEANGTANSRAISIETEDINTRVWPKWNTNDGAAVPAWTDAQVQSIAKILAWASTQHAIPLVGVASSGSKVRGIAYHRLGVPGHAGATSSITGGELWSSAAGKVCPGPRRTAQIPGIINMAVRLRDGGSKTLVKPAPQPTIPPEASKMQIELYVAGDGSFRATAMVETDSPVASDAYVTLGSTWGGSTFGVTALRHDGAVLGRWDPVVQNNCQWSEKLPSGTRVVTFEGNVQVAPTAADRGTGPAAAIWEIPPHS